MSTGLGPPLRPLGLFLLMKCLGAQTSHPIMGDSPESFGNIVDYTKAQPTFPPAPFNGVYCRGGACQYRVPPLVPPPPTVPPVPAHFGLLRNREFCRGKGCIGGPVGVMGWPVSSAVDQFSLNCAHLFNDVANGLKGEDGKRSLKDVHASFLDWCKKRVAVLEVGACPAYADVVMMALSPAVDAPSQGSVGDVCTLMFLFIESMKTAEVDLKLVSAALPSSPSLLAKAFYRLTGAGGIGPTSWRGREWVAELEKRKFPYVREQPASLVQEPEENIPKYKQDPPCVHDAQSGTKQYQILPGSPDGAIPPIEVDGRLFEYCRDQFSEIMAGFAQTGHMTATMTKDWCAWQSSVTSWAGTQESGRPDWSFRNCNNMHNFMAFALRNYLDKGLTSIAVCKKIFLALGPIHRVDALVADAWTVSVRGSAALGLSSAVDSKAMKELVEKAQAYANQMYSKMRGQKKAFNDLNDSKMDLKAFDNVPGTATPPKPRAPDLPTADEFMALLQKHVPK